MKIDKVMTWQSQVKFSTDHRKNSPKKVLSMTFSDKCSYSPELKTMDFCYRHTLRYPLSVPVTKYCGFGLVGVRTLVCNFFFFFEPVLMQLLLQQAYRYTCYDSSSSIDVKNK